MSFDVVLLALGTLLLLLGLLGRVEVKELSVGTASRGARLVAGAFGVLFVAIALSQHIGFSLGAKAKQAVKSAFTPRVRAQYLVVASTGSLPEAKRRVDELASASYSAEARRSVNGQIAVAVQLPEGVKVGELKAALLSRGLCGNDAYPSTGEKLVELLYPVR